MAAGLELRAPLLDPAFVEMTARIPAALKFRGFGGLKRLLKRALADRLPPEIAARRKKGFEVPFGQWFRGPLVSTLSEILAAERLRSGGLFNPGAVACILSPTHARKPRPQQDALGTAGPRVLAKSPPRSRFARLAPTPTHINSASYKTAALERYPG